MFYGLVRDPPAEARAHDGRITVMHPAINSGVEDVGERLAEAVV